MSIITLTTDFGGRDWFVGSLKGVILGVNPEVTVVDITHEIPAGDVRAAAFALRASYRCFPNNTVHVAVVDPGVGSSRAAIGVRTARYVFVGPDNGVLSFALAGETDVEIRRLDNDAYFRKPVSHTFHGRDVFAPVAARLTQNVPFDSLGERLTDCVRLDWPRPGTEGGRIRGAVICIDHFGNAITNIELPRQGASRVCVPDKVQCAVRRFYQDGPPNQPLALMGSSGFLEIAVNGGNAARMFALTCGDPVEVW
ncbi:MAG TPA: SAM-dependent chlorinase/fluorinase [Verrucomicrobiae bacterium]|nr:SAM-dependent chlorinase/fluorinase [Verrucomicrobiae bacterium]